MIHLTCPGCQAVFEVDDNFAGEKVECYNCKTKFIVPGLPATEITSQVSVPEENAPVESSPVLPANETTPAGDEKACPFCGEMIKTVSIKCKHCQTFLKKSSFKTSIGFSFFQRRITSFFANLLQNLKNLSFLDYIRKRRSIIKIEVESGQTAIANHNQNILPKDHKPFKVNKKTLAVAGLILAVVILIASPYFESAKTQYERGKSYEDEGNEIKAAKWYLKAAEQGNADAQYALGQLLVDVEKSLQWYERASAQGHAGATSSIGQIYWYGSIDVKKDRAEAAKWYRKAAELYKKASEQGDADAMEMLAFYYKDGKGVKMDKAEASKWFCKAVEQYRKAAQGGNADAMYNLAVYYENGYGVKKDKAEALKWVEQYRKVAEQGKSNA